MKNVTYAIAALMLGTLSFSGFAAQLVQQTTTNQKKGGVYSATVNNSNLSKLHAELAAQADTNSVKSYKFISALSENNLHGATVIYQ